MRLRQAKKMMAKHSSYWYPFSISFSWYPDWRMRKAHKRTAKHWRKIEKQKPKPFLWRSNYVCYV